MERERERGTGRFVSKGLDGQGGSAGKQASARPMRPEKCRTYARTRLAEALPEILETFVQEAKKGSIAHTKLLTSLGGLDKGTIPEPKQRRTKGFVALLMDRLGEGTDGDAGGK